ncbi:MAG: asparagine synthase (glutamine-hydrolyzing) [Endomicrobium sp.]|jgi:asparagine synthase (glutamine-hydrolysing)|nr:asparagine synthase (glutamine-hydrolyzing) [Endomicrobium sp.]
MCGIVGIIDKDFCNNQKSLKDIKIMTESIKHRGPDQIKIDSCANGIHFGFVRLAMVDIEKSKQPIVNSQGNLFLYFNGEIYNYKKLRLKLETNGYTFKTNGDGEVILALYERERGNCLKHLDGMFAVCIINSYTNEIFIARDKYGIKPLYYCVNNERILISSELKAIKRIMQNSCEINEIGLELYLRMRFIPAPYTIFKNIYKVKAGESILFKRDKLIKKDYHLYNEYYSFENRLDFEKILYENIIETSKADVPIGIFLSGGIDSGIIASCLTKGNQIMNSFTVGYSEKENCNEIVEAKYIANNLGIPNISKCIYDNEILTLINKAIYHLDEPLYSSVAVCSLKLAQIASKFVKGILSGDGSDELVFGYKYLRNALLCRQENDLINQYISGIGWLKYIDVKKIFLKSSLTDYDFKEILFDGCKMNNLTETLRRVEIFKRLPDYHFARVDRMTMAYGIEARLPYLRDGFVNTMLSIDSDFFLKHLDPKYMLKQNFKKILPESYLSASKKPFTSPIKSWIERYLRNDIEDLFNNEKLINKIGLNKKCINDLWNNYKGEYWEVCNVWGIYILLKWFLLEFFDLRGCDLK